MKAAMLTALRRFEIRLVPEPRLAGATDVMVRMKTVGVCGSDVHYFAKGRIGSQSVRFPFVLGHEAAGVVETTGSGVSGVRPGTRVAIDPAVSCGHCDQCLSGREHTCRTLRFLGSPDQLGGSLCEYIVLPERNCYPIGGEITFEQAALAEPLAIAVYAVERSALPHNAALAILGAGPIGMSVFHVLRTMHTGRVYVSEKIDARLAFAGRLDPAWAGSPDRVDLVEEISRREPLLLDRVFECSGDPEAIAQGLRLLKPGGVLVIVGIPEVDSVAFPIHDLRRNEITIVNIRRQVRCTEKALHLLASGAVRMDAMVTHRWKLDQCQAAFELVERRGDGVMKAVVSAD